MTYNQLAKKYGIAKVNTAYEAWEKNGTIRTKGIIMTPDIKGCAPRQHKCIEMIITGELA